MDSVTVTVIIVIGVIALIEAVNIMLKIPLNDNSDGMTALAVFDKNDDVSIRLENIIHKLRWTDNELILKVIIIEDDLDDTQIKICKDFCEKYEFLEMSDTDNICSLIFPQKNNLK